MGDKLFSIHSVSSDCELIFSSRKGEYFHVELKEHGLSVSTNVWTTTEIKSINEFFQELSSYRNPWQGIKGWAAPEGEFEISATCTTLGHVIFSVNFVGQLGDVEEWKAQAMLETEIGQLENIARDANVFFAG